MHESSYSQNSHVDYIDDNEIYFSIIREENKKGNVKKIKKGMCILGGLIKKFTSSTSAHSTTN